MLRCERNGCNTACSACADGPYDKFPIGSGEVHIYLAAYNGCKNADGVEQQTKWQPKLHHAGACIARKQLRKGRVYLCIIILVYYNALPVL